MQAAEHGKRIIVAESPGGILELIDSGGVAMYPLAVIAAVVLVLSAVAVRRLRSTEERPGPVVETGIDAILFCGAFAIVVGVIGTLGGIVQAAQAVELAGGRVEPSLVWGGLRVTLITALAGLVMFAAAGLLWFVLRLYFKRRLLDALGAAALLFAGGCGFGPPDADRIARSDSAGIQIVASAGVDRPLEWRFEPVWSIGGAGDERLTAAELGPHHVAADEAGRVYVLDEAAHRVLVLSADGRVVDALGREGGGPGELKAPVSLTLETDGTVAVYDYGKRGLVRWTAEGEPLDLARIEARFWGPRIEATGGGALFTALEDDAGDTSRQRLALWSRAADRTLARLARMPDRAAEFPTCGIRGIPIAPLFAPELVWDAEGTRVAANAGAAYVIDLYESGRRVRSIRRDIAPRPVDERMALREVGDGLPIPVAGCVVPPAEVVRGRGYADVLPSLRELAVSPKGEVWALRGGVADEPARIDVFASDGSYLGTLPSDAPFPAAFLRGDRVIAVERDSLDVPRVALYGVSRP